MSGVSEKRRHPRLPVNLTATYRSDSFAGDVRVTNLSQDGLSVACGGVDVLGASGEITLILDPQKGSITLPLRVIWVSSNPDREFGMGLQFQSLAEPQRMALNGFLRRNGWSDDEPSSTE